MISVGNKPAVLVRGDFHPAELYIGNHKITGWNTSIQSGQSLSFQNTYHSPFDELVISGATNQESTTGKNLLDLSNTMRFSYNRGNIPNTLIAGATYTCTILDGHEFRYRLYASNRPGNGDYPLFGGYLGSGQSYTFVAPENISTYSSLSLCGLSLSAGEIDPVAQIELGESSTDYEPYTGGQPSPSPDYPQSFTDATGTITDGHSVVTIPATMQGVSYRVTPGKVEKVEGRSRQLSSDGRATGYTQFATPITTDITATPLGQSLLQLACHRGGTQITQSSGNLPFALSATAKTYGQGV